MPDSITIELDEIDQEAAVAGQPDFERGAEMIQNGLHRLDVAAASSDIWSSPEIVAHATALSYAIAKQYEIALRLLSESGAIVRVICPECEGETQRAYGCGKCGGKGRVERP